MHQYTELEDEQLVSMFQSGDDDAFTELFRRYDRTLIRLSRNAAARFPSFYEDEFYGYFQERFVKIVQEFDTTLGVYFTYYCKFKFTKLPHDYVRRKLYPRDMEGNRYTAYRDINKVTPSELTDLNVPDERYTAEQQLEVEDTDLYKYLAKKNPIYQIIVLLITQGYTYSEIAERLGRTGTDAALRNWTARIVKKIRNETIEYYESDETPYEINSFVN